ncbi:MAG: hypothetical protein JW910_22750 [Anaerolineae bacterium]|nr:hypothetical protein [Anaerolineae bacterium]
MLDATLRILVKVFARRGVVMTFDDETVTLAYPGSPPTTRTFDRRVDHFADTMLCALRDVSILAAIDQRGGYHDHTHQ